MKFMGRFIAGLIVGIALDYWFWFPLVESGDATLKSVVIAIFVAVCFWLTGWKGEFKDARREDEQDYWDRG